MIRSDEGHKSKVQKLEEFIRQFTRVMIAFSGECESALVAKVARDLLGRENVLTVTSKSKALPEANVHEIERLVQTCDVRHQWIIADEVGNAKPYQFLLQLARLWRAEAVLNGDCSDGLTDSIVKSPLAQAGFTKEDVRTYAKEIGIIVLEKTVNS